jgi:phosphoribosyl-AMP cyclohydrolase
MPTYYCHDCARAAGLLTSVYTSSLTGTAYQWEKVLKHTLPNPRFNYQSEHWSLWQVGGEFGGLWSRRS